MVDHARATWQVSIRRPSDFVHDQLFDGTKIRALTIVDTLTRAIS